MHSSVIMTRKTKLSWNDIETVFLDLDGTLLDKYFDDFFWESHVPATYAQKNGLEVAEAKEKLLAVYRCVESTLQWTDLDYWSERLQLDIVALKREVSHLIQLRPDVLEFFAYLNKLGKEVFLITNAHPKTLAVKLEKVPIGHLFERIVCSQDLGFAKEQPEFWHELAGTLAYSAEHTLFADDTEKVLSTAKHAGIGHLIHIASPSSRLSPRYAKDYLSISSFRELMDR